VHALNAALSSPVVVKPSNEQLNGVEHRPQDAHAFGKLIAIEQDSRYFRSRNERIYPMEETKKHNAEPSTAKATSVVDYIVQRLADEGITDCFGVPGDYAFPVCDAVERNPNI